MTADIEQRSNTNTCALETTNTNGNPTLALIGCGPAGMSFLHALARLRNELEETGDIDGLAKLPIVTCYESAPGPGGVWRARSRANDGESNNFNVEIQRGIGSEGSDDSKGSIASDDSDVIIAGTVHGTNMYEALWTNGSKELTEYFDYSYEEHFQRPLPVYMPRQSVLEYMICRVTRNNPDFFKLVNFNSTVKYVIYDEMKAKFEVTVQQDNKQLSQKDTYYFDKCIWGAGQNGQQALPRSVHNMLGKGGFKGKIMHSADIGNYFAEIKDKEIVIIGDAYSAEDLTLQAIKLGVDFVTIYSRSGTGVCSEMGSWPMEKVEVIDDYMPTEVIQDGHGLRWAEAEFDLRTWKHVPIVGGKMYDMENVDAVIYCTGYQSNTSMLDPSLSRPYDMYDDNYHGVSTDFKMLPNILSGLLGDVTPCEKGVESSELCVIPGIYRGILISNPNMMFICEGYAEVPLFEIDVNAHLVLSYVTGKLTLPDEETMNLFNKNTVMKGMQDILMRHDMDRNYCLKWADTLSDDHWANNGLKMMHASCVNKFKLVAQDMQDASYPLNIGNGEMLNAKGEHLVNLLNLDEFSRVALDPKSKDSAWRTFRDRDYSNNVSLYSGAIAVPFNGPWMDAEEADF